MCGLDIKKKWGVSSVGTALDQADYGDPDAGGLPVVRGLHVAGVPVGPVDFVAAETEKAATEKVVESFAAISSLPKAQVQNLLARMCGGNVRVQNLWQVVNPTQCVQAQENTDQMTIAAILRSFWDCSPNLLWVFASDNRFCQCGSGGWGFRWRRLAACPLSWGGFARPP